VPPPQRTDHRDRDWIVAYVGKVRYDSLRIINLKEGCREYDQHNYYHSLGELYDILTHFDPQNEGNTRQ
jgi:hypothetical protein